MGTKRNRLSLGDSVKILDFVRDNKIDSSIYRPEDLCALVETNTGITLSPVQLRNIYREGPGLEWNVIGSKNAEGKDRRRTSKMRLDELEPKHDELAEKVAILTQEVERLTALVELQHFTVPAGTISPLDIPSG